MLLLAGSVCQSQHIDRFGPKSRHCKVIYPRKRTSESRTGMSDMGQKRSYGKSSNTMTRRKSLAAGVTVQFFAFV